MAAKLNALALGYASAIVSAFAILVLWVLGNVGIYRGAVRMVEDWQLAFSLTLGGLIAGMIEAAVVGFIFAYLFGLLYNRFA